MLTIEDKRDRAKTKLENSGEKLKKIYIPELDGILITGKYRGVLIPYTANGYLPGDVEIDKRGNWYQSICDARPQIFPNECGWLRYKNDPRQRVYMLPWDDGFNYRAIAKKYIDDLMHKDTLYYYDSDRCLMWLLDASHQPYAVVCGIRALKECTTVD